MIDWKLKENSSFTTGSLRSTNTLYLGDAEFK